MFWTSNKTLRTDWHRLIDVWLLRKAWLHCWPSHCCQQCRAVTDVTTFIRPNSLPIAGQKTLGSRAWGPRRGMTMNCPLGAVRHSKCHLYYLVSSSSHISSNALVDREMLVQYYNFMRGGIQIRYNHSFHHGSRYPLLTWFSLNYTVPLKITVFNFCTTF